MKKLIVLLLVTGSLFNATHAQVRVNVNIGSQPVWGPVGYDHVDYYYFPDIDAYYYVPQHQYVYLQGNRWVFAPALPPRYANFDVYHSYKVVVNEPKPYLHNDVYVARYKGYRGRHDQPVIRDSHEEKYFVIKEHPEHGKWHGNAKGHGKHDH